MDRLQATDFVRHLSGRIFLTQFQAIAALTPELLAARSATGPAGEPAELPPRSVG
jgi:SulP family sulfate permease